MQNVFVKDVYGDEVDVGIFADHFLKGEHPGTLVMMNCDNDMMMTPKQARDLAAALILAADAASN